MIDMFVKIAQSDIITRDDLLAVKVAAEKLDVRSRAAGVALAIAEAAVKVGVEPELIISRYVAALQSHSA